MPEALLALSIALSLTEHYVTRSVLVFVFDCLAFGGMLIAYVVGIKRGEL